MNVMEELMPAQGDIYGPRKPQKMIQKEKYCYDKVNNCTDIWNGKMEKVQTYLRNDDATYLWYYARFEVVTAVTMKNAVFLDIKPS
jgi:hypothetical protein